MVEFQLFLLAAAIGGGVAGGVGVGYLLFKPPSPKGKGHNKSQEPQVTVARAEVERARRELKALLLEKDLLANALTRVYEAEAEGRITREERDRLAAKYKEQLREVEKRLGDLDLLIEVGELERLREELIGLFERKIAQLDERLQRARAQLERLGLAAQPPKPAKGEEQAQPPPAQKSKAPRRRKAPGEEVDEKVRELREEILEALARLEQIDLEGE
jgi:hypothetical protein